VNDIHTNAPSVSSTNLGSYLKTAYFAANTAMIPFTNDTVRFAVHVVSSDPGYLFSPNGLTFTEKSSDGLINYSFAYTNPPASYFGYDSQAMGIVWGSNGASSIVYTNSQNWTNLVSEFIFIWPQSVCYAYDQSYPLVQLSNYLNSVSSQVTGTWSLDDGTINPVVTSKRTFYRSGTPFALSFTDLNKLSGHAYQLSFTSGWNDTWTIQSSYSLSAPSADWTDVSTVNGITSVICSSTNANCFFRAILQ